MTGLEPAVIATIIGTGISAIGQISAGISAQNAANFNAQVAFNNANAARLAAAEDAKRQKRLGLKRQGANRALDPDKLDLLEDSALEEELAFQSILHAGEVQAVGFDNTARLEIAKGKSAASSAVFGALTTVAGGAFSGFGGPSPNSILLGSSASTPGQPIEFFSF